MGTILEVTGHILSLEILTETGKLKVLCSSRSFNIFPAGWCNQFGFELYSDSQDELDSQCSIDDGKEEILEPVVNEVKDSKPVSFVRPLPLPNTKESSWCPPIYFNHLCYSASFLRY